MELPTSHSSISSSSKDESPEDLDDTLEDIFYQTKSMSVRSLSADLTSCCIPFDSSTVVLSIFFFRPWPWRREDSDSHALFSWPFCSLLMRHPVSKLARPTIHQVCVTHHQQSPLALKMQNKRALLRFLPVGQRIHSVHSLNTRVCGASGRCFVSFSYLSFC